MKMEKILIFSAIFAIYHGNQELVANESDQLMQFADKNNSAQQSPIMNIGLSANFDCIHNFNLDKGKSQNCIQISNLRLTAEKKFERIYTSITINPFSGPVYAYANRPMIDRHPNLEGHELTTIESYKLGWNPRPHLEIALESFSGSAIYPTTSPLSMANPFMESGWKQTALTVTYNLHALPEMMVRFAAGNGEGENGKNIDTQQYFGFDINAIVINGVKGHFGVSLDGNSAGSDENSWRNQILREGCNFFNDLESNPSTTRGYSTQRLSLGAIVNGIWPGSEGMQLGIGYQRNILSDLSKKQRSQATAEELAKCPRILLDSFFIENTTEDVVNTVQRTIYNIDFVFRNTDFFLSTNYSLREVDTGSVKLFDICIRDAENKCTEVAGNPVNNIRTDSFAVGTGLFLTKISTFSIEYQIQNYDKLYNIANFSDRNGNISQTRDVFGARYSVTLP